VQHDVGEGKRGDCERRGEELAMKWLPILTVFPVLTVAERTRHWEARFLEEYPLALCNDGSPGAYYYSKGAQGSDLWMVFLEGGMWCWDEASCRTGFHGTSSSTKFVRKPSWLAWWASKLHGLFDAESSPLSQAHIAYVRTCSNDAFLGDISPSPRSTTRTPFDRWHFRGARIVEAVFLDLRARTGLGAYSTDRVLYGGCSAGARGALVSLDYVAASLAGKAQVLGLFDSPFWVPIDPFGPNLESFEVQTMKANDLFGNSTYHVNAECEQAYPNASWKCMFPAFRLPFVRTPYFLSHSQYDKFAINWNLRRFLWLPKNKLNATVRRFADEYRRLVRMYLQSPMLQSGSTVFSSACYFHCTFGFQFANWVRVGGLTVLEHLEAWLAGAALAGGLREDCTGFDCGSPGGLVSLEPALLSI